MVRIRVERDSLGAVEVPAERYYGAQTARSLVHFAIGSERMPMSIVKALALVKKAAAEVNAELGLLAADKSAAISAAADEILSGMHAEEFPLSVWQTGSGTQTNMNVNEVIANRAIVKLGGEAGSKKPVHPNDDVNMSHSSNDAFPTAMHLAIAAEVTERLLPAARALQGELESKSREYSDIMKLGRTHLMDAVPMTLGQEFSGYAAQVEDGIGRIMAALDGMRELAIGGTAVGTGLNAPTDFGERMAAKLSVLTGFEYRSGRNKFALLAAHDAAAQMSASVRTLAGALKKIAEDIRWMASGPRAGLGELTLPANEPGSSIMPGKVNPTQCEAMAMVCVQVIGLDSAVAVAAASGNFELNVYKPLIARNVLESIGLIADACSGFRVHALEGLKPETAVMERNARNSLMLATAIAPIVGYDEAARAARLAGEKRTTLKEAVIELKLMTAEEFDAATDPRSMASFVKET